MSAQAGAPLLVLAESSPGAGRQARVTLLAALGVGVLGDWLLRAPGPPGAGFALWVLSMVLTTAALGRSWQVLSREAAVLVGAAALLALAIVWRDSPPLKLLDAGCAAVLLALVAYRRHTWLRGARVLSYARALLAAGVSAAFGAPVLAAEVDWRELAESAGPGRRHALALLRGLVLALPLLALFGALLAGADAVFSRLLSQTLRVDVGSLLGHAVLCAFLAWLAAGYLRQLRAGPLRGSDLTTVRFRPRLSMLELAVPLGLVDLLFAAFVAVQVRYLFGGAATVQETAGLTYADYARRGFFELVAVAALVLPLLLAADALLERRGARDERLFRVLAGTQLALVFAIMASALQRMRLYQEAFGLTEQRLYATAFMLWIALALLWLAATALAGRRERFAWGALVSALLALGGLNAANPDALIARVNLARAERGQSFDATYVTSLGGDAVPVLVEGVARGRVAGACELQRGLARRWLSGPGARDDWRLWNPARVRAQAEVRALLPDGAPAPAACPSRTASAVAGGAGQG